MADILIRGMEMPKNCSLCKLAQHRVFACSVMCPITGQTVGYYDEGFHQEDHICPLIPLPEGHVRLIDADKAVKCLRGAQKTQKDDSKSSGWICHGLEIAIDVISSANFPTIVEAEGGCEDG